MGVPPPTANGGHVLSHALTDEKGSRLARPDPIYESLFHQQQQQSQLRQLGGHAHAGTLAVGVAGSDRASEQTGGEESTHDVFTLLNSFWFMIASLLQQGTDLLPRAISTRMVAGMWWFFTLIMISSYTANLAAFLTVERMVSPIESAEDLSKQHSIKYGCLGGGSTAGFFMDSKIDTYSRMWVFMNSDKSNFVSSNALGVKRVMEDDGKYAFLMESTSVEYVIERNCKLTQIGGLLDSKGYGIALPPNSPFRTPMSSAILQLQEGGKLHMLKEKWWKQRKGGGKCKETKEKEANELSLENVGGVFLVLIMGLLIACLIAICERCYHKKERPPLPKEFQGKHGGSQSGGHLSNCTADTSASGAGAGGWACPTATTDLDPPNFRMNGSVGGGHAHIHHGGSRPFSGYGGVGVGAGLSGSMGHLPPSLLDDRHAAHCPGVVAGGGGGGGSDGDGGFLTTSLSAAALNNASCAVPMRATTNNLNGTLGRSGRSGVLTHSNSVSSTPGGASVGWGRTGSGFGGVSVGGHQHQEQCPHYNSDYKFNDEPPS